MISLPPMEYSFKISIKGDISQREFVGEFTYKRMTIKARLESQKWFKKETENIDLDKDTKAIYYMLATLRFSIIKAPEWWEGTDKGSELHDVNVLATIFEEINKFESKWLVDVRAESEKTEEIIESGQ